MVRVLKPGNLLVIFTATLICTLILVVGLAYHHHRLKHSRLLVRKPVFESSSMVGYQPSPDFLAYQNSVVQFTDRNGARVARSKEVPPSQTYYLIVGGSFAYGLGLSYRETMAHLIKKKTGARVYNVAVMGHGTVPAYLRLRRFLYLRPKVVVYPFIHDHLVRNFRPCAIAKHAICRPMPHIKSDAVGDIERLASAPEFYFDKNAYQESRPFFDGMSLRHRFGLADVYWYLKQKWLRLTGADSGAVNQKAIQGMDSRVFGPAFLSMMRAFAYLAEQHQFPFVAMYVPRLDRPKQMNNNLARSMHALASRGRYFSYIDLTDRVRSMRGKGVRLCLNQHDCHPGQAANKLFADAVLRLTPSSIRLPAGTQGPLAVNQPD